MGKFQQRLIEGPVAHIGIADSMSSAGAHSCPHLHYYFFLALSTDCFPTVALRIARARVRLSLHRHATGADGAMLTKEDMFSLPSVMMDELRQRLVKVPVPAGSLVVNTDIHVDTAVADVDTYQLANLSV